MYYVGILGGAGEVWGMRIPDCPGCHGGGATADATISDAISALRLVRAARRVMAEDGAFPRTAPNDSRVAPQYFYWIRRLKGLSRRSLAGLNNLAHQLFPNFPGPAKLSEGS
jgi:hypothetical protein